MLSNLMSNLTPEFALWLCVGLLLAIALLLERLGRAIAGLHRLIFLINEDKIEGRIADRIAYGRHKDG